MRGGITLSYLHMCDFYRLQTNLSYSPLVQLIYHQHVFDCYASTWATEVVIYVFYSNYNLSNPKCISLNCIIVRKIVKIRIKEC